VHDLWVHQDKAFAAVGIFLVLRHLDDDKPLEGSNLRGRQAQAIGRVHGLQHIICQPPQVSVKGFHPAGLAAKNGIDAESTVVESDVSLPPEGMGDIAYPLFRYSKTFKKGPQEIAKHMADYAKNKESEFIEKTVASGPYINFYARTDRMTEIALEAVMEMERRYQLLEEAERRIEVLVKEEGGGLSFQPLEETPQGG
jgi:hypothetical protein